MKILRLVVALSFLLLAVRASAQAPPFSYRGLWEGMLPDGSSAYIFVRNNDDAYFTMARATGPIVARAQFTVANDGTFAFIADGIPIAGSLSAQSAHFLANSTDNTIPRAYLGQASGIYGMYFGWFLFHPAGSNITLDAQILAAPSGRFYMRTTNPAFDTTNNRFDLLYYGTVAADGSVTCTDITGGSGFSATMSGTVERADGVLNGYLDTTGGIYLKATKENVDYRLTNISTRGKVGTAADQMIAGFIIKNGAKRVLIRAIGPTLGQPPFNIPGTLPDPVMELHSATATIATNDNWQTGNDVAAIDATGLAPGNAAESALLVTLEEGPYTVVVSGAGGATGVALVEVYEID